MKVLILDNIRSAYNVGSIFRSADCAGIDRIILCGITPTPMDRFGRLQREIEKTSLGAVNHISYIYNERIEDAIKSIEDEYEIIAVEQTEGSIPYKEYKLKENVAFIFGNEVEGIGDSTLALVDGIIEIPMHGKKESLNVAVSVGVVLFNI